MSIAPQRVSKEFRKMSENPHPLVFDLSLVNDNVLHWNFIFRGPSGTPYGNGKFKIDCKFPVEYPTVPPVVILTTKIFCPNVDPISGGICQAFFAHWTPGCSMKEVLEIVETIFTDFSHDHVNVVAGKMWREDNANFLVKAVTFTKDYAS